MGGGNSEESGREEEGGKVGEGVSGDGGGAREEHWRSVELELERGRRGGEEDGDKEKGFQEMYNYGGRERKENWDTYDGTEGGKWEGSV